MLRGTAVTPEELVDHLNLWIGLARLHLTGVHDDDAIGHRASGGIRRSRAEQRQIGAIAVLAERQAVRELNDRREELGQHFRSRRVGDVDRIDVAGAQVGAVIGQPVGRKGAFVPSNVGHELTAARQSDFEARQQLRRPAVARDVIQVDFRTAIAVQGVDGTKQLPAVVDLERLPRVDHRRCLQVGRRSGSRCIGRIDSPYADVRAIGRCRGGVEVRTVVTCLVDEPRVLPARSIAAHLPDKLQIAAEPLESARRPQRRRYLAL